MLVHNQLDFVWHRTGGRPPSSRTRNQGHVQCSLEMMVDMMLMVDPSNVSRDSGEYLYLTYLTANLDTGIVDGFGEG